MNSVGHFSYLFVYIHNNHRINCISPLQMKDYIQKIK